MGYKYDSTGALVVTGVAFTGGGSPTATNVSDGLDASVDVEAIKNSIASLDGKVPAGSLANISTKIDQLVTASAAQKELSEVFVRETGSGNLYVRTRSLDETTVGTDSVQFYELDGTLAAPQPTGPFESPTSGATAATSNIVQTELWEGTGAGTLAQGALVSRVLLLDSAGVPLSVAWIDPFTSAAVTVNPGDAVDSTGTLDELLQAMQVVIGSNLGASATAITDPLADDATITDLLRYIGRLSTPTAFTSTDVVLSALNETATYDATTFNNKGFSHRARITSTGMVAAETITVVLEGSTDNTEADYAPIGANATLTITENETSVMYGSQGGINYFRLRVFDYNSAAGSLNVRLSASEGAGAN